MLQRLCFQLSCISQGQLCVTLEAFCCLPLVPHLLLATLHRESDHDFLAKLLELTHVSS